MITAWRITKRKYAHVAFTGIGARLSGGRWNSPGTTVIYAAGTISLGILEVLVHIQSDELLQRYVCFPVNFDESLVKEVDVSRLPRYWWRSPTPKSTRRIGDSWIAEGDRPVLRVPSVIVRREWNYLLNPLHPDFPRVEILSSQPLRLDKRLG